MTTRALIALCTLAACLHAAPVASAQSLVEPVDCTGPAPAAEPGTPAWHEREAENAWCATQRNIDTKTNPLYTAAEANRAQHRLVTAMDPMREPILHDGTRFRFDDQLSFTDSDGKSYPALLFRPCDDSCTDMPAGLRTHEPPYPGVVIMHGGAANQEMYLWAAEGLAEAGYMVLTINLGRTDSSHYRATREALDWLLSTPAEPYADGSHNPRHAELDRARIGLAGHSAGGVAVSRIGQEDPRVSAIASWDRAQSSTMPADLPLRTPGIFFVADYNCQRVPVCLPEPYGSPPDPHGPGNKDEDFTRLREARVDTMKVALRAAVHLDWTEWPELNASRYGAITTLYYTRAWFDRYVKGDRAAAGRLVAERYDDSADVHSISSGRFDPQTVSNVPPRIEGHAATDRLSFHFRSGYWLERGKLACDDIRAGCETRPAPGPDRGKGKGPAPR